MDKNDEILINILPKYREENEFTARSHAYGHRTIVYPHSNKQVLYEIYEENKDIGFTSHVDI